MLGCCGGIGKRCMCGGGRPGGRCRGIIPGLAPRRPPGGAPTWLPICGTALYPSEPSLFLGPIPAGSPGGSSELPTRGIPGPGIGGGGPEGPGAPGGPPMGGTVPGGRNPGGPGGICMGLKPGLMKGGGGGAPPRGKFGGGMPMGPWNPGGTDPSTPIGWPGGACTGAMAGFSSIRAGSERPFRDASST